MRPISLQLRGFTAFRDPQEIDFSGLDLFALWGPTGSGKSSVLDAMTYALYGKVERVGNQISQLVSQGQPRMSVMLTFEVDGRRYRITRSTPASGASKVLLERHADGDWRSFGDGADRAQGVKRAVAQLVGLDYNAFTRAVLLPQGKFAEFLVGDATERRAILTELLGLELFGRMAGLARGAAQDAKKSAEARMSLLESFADVDEAALERAVREAERAEAVVNTAEKIEKDLDGLASRWDEYERRAEAIVECANEMGELSRELETQARTLDAVTEEFGKTASRVRDATTRKKAAGSALDKLTAQKAKSEDRWGSYEHLLELQAVADRLAVARGEASRVDERVAAASAAVAKAKEALAGKKKELDRAAGDKHEAEHEVAEKELALADGQRSDLVGALTKGLKKGDPCPVCDRPLTSVKKASPKQLQEAERALQAARRATASAAESWTTAKERVAAATSALAEKKKRAKESASEVKSRAAEVKGLTQRLRASFETKLPPDPGAVLAERTTALKELTEAHGAAEAEVRDAGDALVDEERRAAELRGKLAEVRSALAALKLDAAVTRAAKAAGDLAETVALPTPLPQKPDLLHDLARAGAASLAGIEDELRGRAAKALEERAAILEQARERVRDIVPAEVTVGGRDPKTIAESFKALARDLEKESVAAAERVRSLTSDLERRRGLEKEIEQEKATQAVYNSLALELRGDRIVDYLQSEALVALAAAGSDRLAYLSGGRYRLAFESDEFFVVDAWNGEDRRSVKTLSGGETFLASLALALALSDEVRNLAVADKAPIDSLFLDEGFGQLDAESLEVVISAIEQLGGNGRMVGVITHVPELAERLPVRLVVEKSPRGSRLRPDLREEIPLR